MAGVKIQSHKKRRQFVHLITSVDHYWGEVFEDNLFYDLNYSDLFTRMWLESEEPFRKTDLYQFMPKVSQRTAAKYIQIAIDRGLLLERPDTEDRRSKRITIADDLKIRIERFLDYSIDVFNKGLK
jgi:hypothetical protein